MYAVLIPAVSAASRIRLRWQKLRTGGDSAVMSVYRLTRVVGSGPGASVTETVADLDRLIPRLQVRATGSSRRCSRRLRRPPLGRHRGEVPGGKELAEVRAVRPRPVARLEALRAAGGAVTGGALAPYLETTCPDAAALTQA